MRHWLPVALVGTACSLSSLDDLQRGGSDAAPADSGAAGQAVGGVGGVAGVGGGGTTSDAGDDSDAGAGGGGGHVVSGNVSIINAPGASKTSVILVPIATFAPAAIHDALPAGPKASGVTGPFAIPNVPNGSYFVLVAWENDGLVLDPSWSISGGAAKTPEVTVAGADVVLDTFKATEALGVISPGGPDGSAPSNPLAFVWKDDSSEDHFEVRLVDSSGKTVWQKLDVPGVSGSDVSVAYTGPALASGQKFQFRATSVKGSVPMSRTEDLRGVFVAP